MAITREPSLRIRGPWMKWANNGVSMDFFQSSSNSSSSSGNSRDRDSKDKDKEKEKEKDSGAAEIVHLGGSRVNAPEAFSNAAEELRRALVAAKPTLAVGGGGRAGSSASLPDSPVDPRASTSSTGTLWPTLKPVAEASATSFAPTDLRPAPLRTTTPEGTLGIGADGRSVTPNPPRWYSSLTDSPDRLGLGGLRRSHSTTDMYGRGHGVSIARSQKKALPPMPIEESHEEQESREDVWPPSYISHPTARGWSASSLRDKDGVAKSLIPPPAGPPPTAPLPSPLIKGTLSSQARGGGESMSRPRTAPQQEPDQHQQQQQQQQHTTPPMPTITMTTAEAEPGTPRRAGAPQLTSQERLWLHRNYRGEAPFLKAWGLSIESEEEREEGRVLLLELMQAEKENNSHSNSSSTSEDDASSYYRSSLSSATSSSVGTAVTTPLPYPSYPSQNQYQQYKIMTPNTTASAAERAASEEGLHIILEEDSWGSAALMSPTDGDDDPYNNNHHLWGADDGARGSLDEEHHYQQQNPLQPLPLALQQRKHPPPAWSGVLPTSAKEHARSGSEGSVLHAYLQSWDTRR